jgi:glutamyl-tRNA reductase
MSSREGAVELTLLGVNHRGADVATREALAFRPEEALALLRASRSEPALAEALLLSTCNRVELYACAADPEAGLAALERLLGAAKGATALAAASSSRYVRRGVEAARHLCLVAAGVDSMLLGEPQILGQVKDAAPPAREAGSLGVRLERLVDAAVHAGKRARSETEVGAGAVSVAAAAVTLAAKVFGDLRGCRVLVVGAGDTGALAARHFAERRPRSLSVTNRTPERALALAEALGARAVPWGSLGSELAEADVVATATSAPGPVIDAGMVSSAQRRRGGRPLVLVDVAVPRDVEPRAGALENVFLHDVDALQALVDQSLARRRREVPRVEAIAAEEADRWQAWVRGLEAAPVVRELRAHFERVCAQELAEGLRHFPVEEQPRVERLTRSLVNKLLHLPTTRLKSLDLDGEHGGLRLDTVRRLFAPEGGGDGTKEADRGT